MDISEIKKCIHVLLEQARPHEQEVNDDIDLFSDKMQFEPREFLFVFMELKKTYPVDYNAVIDNISAYTVNQIACAIISQM